MAKKAIKKYSAEELDTLQNKFIAGEKLTNDELVAIGEAEAEEPVSDITKLAEVLADVLDKRKGGVEGGKPFVPLTPEEVAKLPKKSPKKVAEEYYKSVDLAIFPWPGVHVTTDGQIFMGHAQGENARDNHVASNPGMKFESFAKPE